MKGRREMTLEEARETKDRLVEKLFTPDMTDDGMALLNKANAIIVQAKLDRYSTTPIKAETHE
jgi:hypothetical protein